MPTCPITYTDRHGRKREHDGFAMFVALESGDLDECALVALFQHLVNTGMAWQLNGFYSRAAQAFIDAGLIQNAPLFQGA